LRLRAIRFFSSGGFADFFRNSSTDSANFTPARLIASSSTFSSGV